MALKGVLVAHHRKHHHGAVIFCLDASMTGDYGRISRQLDAVDVVVACNQ
jgi:hypothetical protein